MFSLVSYDKNYEYIIDKNTGIVSLEGSIPCGTIGNWYALTYEDLNEIKNNQYKNKVLVKE